MAAIIQDGPESQCRDRNVSNNGLLMNNPIVPLCYHNNELNQVKKEDRSLLQNNGKARNTETRITQIDTTSAQHENIEPLESTEDDSSSSGREGDDDDDADDIEIVIYLDKLSGQIHLDIVPSGFKPSDTEQKIIVATSFDSRSNSDEDEESAENNRSSPDHIQEMRIDLPKFKTQEKHMAPCLVNRGKFMPACKKQVRIQDPNRYNGNQHKMDTEPQNKNISVGKHEKDYTRQTENMRNSGISNKNENTSRNAVQLENIRKSEIQRGRTQKHYDRDDYAKKNQKYNTRNLSSCSDGDLIKKPSQTINNYKNNCPSKPFQNKKITILRRSCENITIPVVEGSQNRLQTERTNGHEMTEKQEKIDLKVSNKVEPSSKTTVHVSNSFTNTKSSADEKTKEQSNRTTVHVSSSCINTKTSADDKKSATQRSHSTVNAVDTKSEKKAIDRREVEKQLKRERKRKRQNKYKSKLPKSDLEIYQRQFETGHLRSKFSRYKTESLRCVKLLELLHDGAFSQKYKGTYQNKQVVLTVYDDEFNDVINTFDMAKMGNSYFVLGFNDCMVGPGGRQWFMSIYHAIGDLQKLLSRDNCRHVIGETHAQFLIAGVLIAVDFLHQHDIVHGNIKPSKVLINNLGYPVLTGFVKMTEHTDRDVCYGHTLAYDAPELKRGPPKDIYSVGCMAYEIIMGWRPFDGETAEQTRQNIMKGERPPYFPELFSYAGELFIDSCLRKNPKERFCIGEERRNLTEEEWFSTLDWREIRRQTWKSPILDAIQLIHNNATLSSEEKSLYYHWGKVMDVMCPNTASFLDLQTEEITA